MGLQLGMTGVRSYRFSACATIAEGAITEDDVRTELGGVIVGAQDGRSSDDDITLFESVGGGLQDLATAELVVARAEELGVGMRLDLGA